MADIHVTRQRDIFKVGGACVDVEYMILGMIMNNVYIISDGTSTIVVDPADRADVIMRALGNRKCDAIFVTHHHSDHTGALRELKQLTGAPVYASVIDSDVIENQPKGTGPMFSESCPVDIKLKDKQTVTVGSMSWRVITTPGHTPGGICFFLDATETDNPGKFNVLVSGDTLFCGSIGRTDFEGGNEQQMRASLRRLSQLPNDTLVLPGHNSLTTIADEQRRVFRFFC